MQGLVITPIPLYPGSTLTSRHISPFPTLLQSKPSTKITLFFSVSGSLLASSPKTKGF